MNEDIPNYDYDRHHKQDGKFVRHIPCKLCGSKDNRALYQHLMVEHTVGVLNARFNNE